MVNTIGKWFQIDGPVMNVINKAGNLIIASFLWVICCLPVITIGPATVALYYAVVKAIRFECGYVAKDFFEAFKRVLLKGILYTIFVLALVVFVVLDREIMAKSQNLYAATLVIVYDGIFILILAFAVYLFSLMTRFDLKIRKMFQLSLVCVFKYLPYTLGILVILLGLGIVAIRLPLLALVIFPGLGCYLYSYLMEPIIMKYVPEPETDEEKTMWYFR